MLPLRLILTSFLPVLIRQQKYRNGRVTGILGDAEKANIKKSIENIQVASTDFRNILGKNRDNVNKIVNSTAVITDKMETIVKDVEQGKGTWAFL